MCLLPHGVLGRTSMNETFLVLSWQTVGKLFHGEYVLVVFVFYELTPPHATYTQRLSAPGEEKIIFYSTQAVACHKRSLVIHFFSCLV
jgi:hypothetical protein